MKTRERDRESMMNEMGSVGRSYREKREKTKCRKKKIVKGQKERAKEY
jgi:hypothetical protein